MLYRILTQPGTTQRYSLLLTQRNIWMLKSRLADALRIEYSGASEKLCVKIEIFKTLRNVLFFSWLNF